MTPEPHHHEISQFTADLYTFLRTHIDTIDVEKLNMPDFLALLDLKKTVDAIVAKGTNRFGNSGMH